uniref:Uncharacterized protein n=1 Tax=Meloidogyne floridensis TaxID=298350 RepID=A0A915NTF0_9BILA
MIEEGYNNSLKEMLKIELTENELKDLLVNSYKIGFKNDILKANLEDINKLTCNGFTSDLLVFINYLNKKFEKTKKLNEWENIKQIILLIIDGLNEKYISLDYIIARVILCKNMLFSLKDFSIKEISIQNYLKEELEILKQKIFVKQPINKGILAFQNQLHSEMILKLLEERPDFKSEMEELKGEEKSNFEYLIKQTNKEENKNFIGENKEEINEYNRITYNCPNNPNNNNIDKFDNNEQVNTIYLNKSIKINSNKNFEEELFEWEENMDEGGNKKLCRIYLFSINLIENNNKYWNEQLDSLNKLVGQIN